MTKLLILSMFAPIANDFIMKVQVLNTRLLLKHIKDSLYVQMIFNSFYKANLP